jgi:uncharacterized protein (DUF4415 family)
MSKRYSKPLTLEELNALKDEDIDFSDIPELTEAQAKTGILVHPDNKTQLTLRLDPNVVQWFKSQGPRYQTRMNAVLRAYYEAQTSKGTATRPRKTGTK